MIVLPVTIRPRALRLVTEWAALNQTELMEDWTLARRRDSIRSSRWSR
jgi:hypothetical protein